MRFAESKRPTCHGARPRVANTTGRTTYSAPSPKREKATQAETASTGSGVVGISAGPQLTRLGAGRLDARAAVGRARVASTNVCADAGK